MGEMSARIRTLSPRQAEAVGHTWHGLTNKEIARAMGCAEDTAKRHLDRAYARLGVDRYGPARGDCPRVLAAVALYRAVQLATRGEAT